MAALEIAVNRQRHRPVGPTDGRMNLLNAIRCANIAVQERIGLDRVTSASVLRAQLMRELGAVSAQIEYNRTVVYEIREDVVTANRSKSSAAPLADEVHGRDYNGVACQLDWRRLP